MSLIQKQYYRLDEVAHSLGLSASDIIYLAENGQLRLSIRVFGLVVEVGEAEEIGPGDWHAWPHGEELRAGLLDLCERDAHQVLKSGAAEVRVFHAPATRYCCLPSGAASLVVTREDLLVRGDRRQRLARSVCERCGLDTSWLLGSGEDVPRMTGLDLTVVGMKVG